MDIEGISGIIHEKRRAFERMTSKLVVLNPHQAFVLLKKTFAIPKLQYVPRASPAYWCREELHIFNRALIDPVGRVANLSLEGVVCKQARFPVEFWSRFKEISPCLLSLPLRTLWESWWKLIFLELA